MNENTNEVVVEKAKRNSPSPEQFCLIWNASDSRQDVLKRIKAAGFDEMSYNAMIARHKQYSASGANLKEIKAANRGKRVDVSAINAAIAAAEQPSA